MVPGRNVAERNMLAATTGTFKVSDKMAMALRPLVKAQA
jgi:hypothetical protein